MDKHYLTRCPYNPIFDEKHREEYGPSCVYKHKECAWNGLHGNNNLLIGDSLTKYINSLYDTQTRAFPGASINSIIQKITNGELVLNGYNIIIYHIGRNNISNNDQPDKILLYFQDLINLTRLRNPNAAIVISQILPMHGESPAQNTTRYTLNKRIESMCKNWDKKCFSFRTWKRFISKYTHIPDDTLFGRDGIHLNKKGYQVIRESIDGNIRTLKGKLC